MVSINIKDATLDDYKKDILKQICSDVLSNLENNGYIHKDVIEIVISKNYESEILSAMEKWNKPTYLT